MDAWKICSIYILTLLNGVRRVLSGNRDICPYYRDDDDPLEGLKYMVCDTGCCGDLFDRECCEDDRDSNPMKDLSTEMIVLIVLGCLLSVIIIISIIVSFVVCMRRKKHRHHHSRRSTSGLQPHQNLGFTENSLRTSTHLSVSALSLPPSYEEAVHQQPSYGSVTSLSTTTSQVLPCAPSYDVIADTGRPLPPAPPYDVTASNDQTSDLKVTPDSNRTTPV